MICAFGPWPDQPVDLIAIHSLTQTLPLRFVKSGQTIPRGQNPFIQLKWRKCKILVVCDLTVNANNIIFENYITLK